MSQKVLNTIPAVLEGRLPSRKRQYKYGTLSKERERERERVVFSLSQTFPAGITTVFVGKISNLFLSILSFF